MLNNLTNDQTANPINKPSTKSFIRTNSRYDVVLFSIALQKYYIQLFNAIPMPTLLV
jgi:hypothetical protein